MKQAGYSKRPRGRSFERRNPKNSNREVSSEPKIRENPQHIVDRYLVLAREATSSGDPVSAENYYQYADHYYRLLIAYRASRTLERRKENGTEISPLPSSPGEESLPEATPSPNPKEYA